MKTVLKNGNVFYQNKIQKLDVEIDGETISQIGHDLDGENIIDCTDLLVTPGFVDLHVHLREPGFEHKGTIKTETLSAKYGGYTHIVAMANTNPCMDDKETIEDFIQRVQKDSSIHTYTYSAITKDLKGQELVDFKENNAFDIVQGFSDDGKGVQSKEMMAKAMKEAKAINSIIVAHCEDEGELEKGACINLGRVSKENGLVGINNASEYNHALRDLQLSKEIGNRYHICHISTKETVAGLREYRKQGLPVSGEACPHHLILTDENIKNLNPNYKMNPPLRSAADVEALVDGLADGTMEAISTDHAPHGEEEKKQSIAKAPFGIVGSETAYALSVTHLVKTGKLTPLQLVEKMSTNPCRILSVPGGTLSVGAPADITIADMDSEYVIDKNTFLSKGKNTPFDGAKVNGRVYYTIVGGNIVYQYE